VTDREKLIDRVRKLMALSSSPNQHEAQLAAEKAQELMLKHGIEAAEASEVRGEAPKFEEHRMASKLDPWRWLLATSIARHLGADCFGERQRRGHRHGTMTFIAPEGMAAALAAMYEKLCDDLEQIYEIEYASEPVLLDPFTGERVSGHTRRASWFLGAVNAIDSRLSKRRHAIEHASVTDGKALVLSKQALKKYMEEMHPDLVSDATNTSGADPYSYARGAEAGKNADFGDDRVTGQRALEA